MTVVETGVSLPSYSCCAVQNKWFVHVCGMEWKLFHGVKLCNVMSRNVRTFYCTMQKEKDRHLPVLFLPVLMGSIATAFRGGKDIRECNMSANTNNIL